MVWINAGCAVALCNAQCTVYNLYSLYGQLLFEIHLSVVITIPLTIVYELNSVQFTLICVYCVRDSGQRCAVAPFLFFSSFFSSSLLLFLYCHCFCFFIVSNGWMLWFLAAGQFLNLMNVSRCLNGSHGINILYWVRARENYSCLFSTENCNRLSNLFAVAIAISITLSFLFEIYILILYWPHCGSLFIAYFGSDRKIFCSTCNSCLNEIGFDQFRLIVVSDWIHKTHFILYLFWPIL